MRDRLIEILKKFCTDDCKITHQCGYCDFGDLTVCPSAVAEHLLVNGIIVPPCKVGDTVYCIDDIVWDDECRDCEHYLIGGFGDPSECIRTRYGNKHPDCIKIIEKVVTQHDIYWWLYSNDFGKTVFPTKSEAERALAERRTGND